MRDLKSARVPEPSARWLRVRVLGMLAFFLLVLGVVFARAVQLTVFQRDAMLSMARSQYVRPVEVPARRGDITDRGGTALATSVEVESVWVDPSLLPDARGAARALARALRLDAGELHQRLDRPRRFVWVKRAVTPQEAKAVRALALPGIGFAKEPRRFYPQRELAAHVLGMVGTDGKGLDGLERSFEDELSGQSARLTSLRDAKGRKLLTQGAGDLLERQGASVTLTLDATLQYAAEKALQKAVADARAAAGTAVVLDPLTGQLLAVANEPRFNPNVPASIVARDVARNRAAMDAIEPGSTMKPFVVAAALEAGTLKPKDSFDCEKGAWKIGRHTINDTHPYDRLDVQGVLQVSSNICTAKIAQGLGRERLVEGYKAFGFGQRADLGLPGEGKGSIPFPKAEVSLATQSFGQGMTTTAVQLAAAFGALANGGVLMKPYLVQKVVDPDGLVLLEHRPTPVRRVVSEKTARTVLAMLESVVTKEGTAPRAAMDAYRVAGKTGTAQKADPVARGYSDKRIASFVGVLPAEDPRAVILVIIDEPKTDVYGGLVAAPAFKEIAQVAMAHLAVPPSRELPADVAAGLVPAVAAKPGKAGARAGGLPSASAPSAPDRAAAAAVAAVTEEPEGGAVRVPDVQGQGGREAVVQLLSAALEPQVLGSGRVVSQSPPPGALVERGARVVLQLAARPEGRTARAAQGLQSARGQ